MQVPRISSNNNYKKNNQTNFKGIEEQKVFMKAFKLAKFDQLLGEGIPMFSANTVDDYFSRVLNSLGGKFSKKFDVKFFGTDMIAFKNGDELITIAKGTDEKLPHCLIYNETMPLDAKRMGKGKEIRYLYDLKSDSFVRHRFDSSYAFDAKERLQKVIRTGTREHFYENGRRFTDKTEVFDTWLGGSPAIDNYAKLQKYVMK